MSEVRRAVASGRQGESRDGRGSPGNPLKAEVFHHYMDKSDGTHGRRQAGEHVIKASRITLDRRAVCASHSPHPKTWSWSIFSNSSRCSAEGTNSMRCSPRVPFPKRQLLSPVQGTSTEDARDRAVRSQRRQQRRSNGQGRCADGNHHRLQRTVRQRVHHPHMAEDEERHFRATIA